MDFHIIIYMPILHMLILLQPQRIQVYRESVLDGEVLSFEMHHHQTPNFR